MECHIYRQPFVLVRQWKDKTNTSRKDNLTRARQLYGKGRQFQIAFQAQNKAERQFWIA